MPDGRPLPVAGLGAGLRGLYRPLPEEVRRCLRPLNLVDECASFVPGLRAPLVASAEAARRLTRLRGVRYPIRRLEGAGVGAGTRLACLVAADPLSERYWRRALFAEPPTEELLGTVPALDVPRAADRLAGTADLSLWQVSWPVTALVGSRPRLPATVPMWLATDRPMADIVRGEAAGRWSRKDEVRRVQRLGLEVRVVTDPAECERFRVHLYAPYGRRRFGDLFAEIPPHAFRHAIRNGWLLMLERAGRPVGGSLLERWRGTVRFLAFGVDADGPVPTALALKACYFHSIRFALERGVPRLSLGTVRPVLADGVLEYKRKWGARLGPPDSWDAFLLRVRNTAAVRDALAAAPLVLDLGRGRLAALGGVGTTAGPPLDVPGVAEIGCLTAADVAAPVPPGVRLAAEPGVWPPGAAA